jgi:hypothetical protein
MAVPLRPPPRDEHGIVVPHDNEGILAEDGVIRRVSERYHVVTDGRGGRRLSSMAFRASSDPNAGMSVDLESSIIEAGLDPKAYVTTPKWMGSVRLRAGDLRSKGFQVGYVPLPDNPHHGEVWGTFSRGKIRALQSIAEWYVPIDGVTL